MRIHDVAVSRDGDDRVAWSEGGCADASVHAARLAGERAETMIDVEGSGDVVGWLDDGRLAVVDRADCGQEGDLVIVDVDVAGDGSERTVVADGVRVAAVRAPTPVVAAPPPTIDSQAPA